MWNKFKDILSNGTTLFVPNVCKFFNWKKKKWVRPIYKETKINIKLEKKSWRKFIRNKEIVDYDKYKSIRNKVRYNTRQLYEDEQNTIAKCCKSNPKKFWNYINNETKSHSKIDELSYVNDQGVQTVVSNDLDKANVLSDYFPSVFNTDTSEVFPPCDVECSTVMDNITMDIEDVKKRLNNLNVYKLYGPDMLHGFYDNTSNITLAPYVGAATRGNKYKSYQSSVKYDLKKHFFTSRVVSLWNILSDEVVDFNAINYFKGRLDKFWDDQSVKYNWDADFTGTGNRSLCYQESLLE